MSRFSQSESAFIKIGFRSSSSQGTLQTIELIGVPGEKLPNGKYAVRDKVRRFFDDLIVRHLFRKGRLIPECDFQELKIWLYDTQYDTQKTAPEIAYEIPNIDDRDLQINSRNSMSKLKTIYVLDNELQGQEYQDWEKVCQELFGSLFDQFIAPPEVPKIIENNNNLVFNLLKSGLEFIESIDRYGKNKQNLFFDALIIQVD